MERLADIQHHVVGRVDDIIDGALPHRFNRPLKPRGRRTDLHALHQRAHIPRAFLRVFDRYREFIRLWKCRDGFTERVTLERRIANSRELLRESAMREAVRRAVREHLHIKHVALRFFYLERVEGVRICNLLCARHGASKYVCSHFRETFIRLLVEGIIEPDVARMEEANVRIPYLIITKRSTPRPKAKPWYFFASTPAFSSTFGCTIPRP